ncbi:hypothetical protein DUNSADRAFT_13132 [Dunaliella salina]|uniref:FAD-binding domain-containing protein n=1 Tax=Dunaliella salina TaxID=3046 RepID=A0ABQ7GA26_DUNSA|nr:hypothetical protein DUNSADRAFT_13132 [Dunaliella salina]|eukprot:KAF5831457.1 hypothetical protein DUNSADRAFT_13132 [Dunaliella salina]
MRVEIRTKDSEPQVTTTDPPTKLMTFRWAKVQNVLASIVEPARVHCGYRVLSYSEVPDNEGGGVFLHFKDKPDVMARFAVAADGMKSPLRAVMLPQDPGPRYLGHMNFNALLYNPGGQETVDAHLPGQLKVFTDVPMGLFGVSCYVIDAGGDTTFWQVRIRSEQPSFTGAPASNGTACPAANDLAPPSSQQQGAPTPWEPSPDGKRGEPAKGPQSDMPYLVGGGLGVPGSKARVLDILDKAGYQDVIRVVQATPETSIFERAILDRIPLDELPPWGDLQGSNAGNPEKSRSPLASPGNRVVLLGDALHAVHPGPGQGARSAFEDAHQLANILEAHRQELSSWKPPNALEPCATSDDSCSEKGNDAEGLAHVVADYTSARLVRVCRMQRMAAEGCGLPHIREHARNAGMARCPNCPVPSTPEETRKRWQEFSRWFEMYPEHPNGDPESTYWKPPPTAPIAVQ